MDKISILCNCVCALFNLFSTHYPREKRRKTFKRSKKYEEGKTLTTVWLKFRSALYATDLLCSAYLLTECG